MLAVSTDNPVGVAAADFFAELADAEANSRGLRCTVRETLDSMDEDTASALEKALADPTIKGTHIAVVLKRRGYTMSSHTVQRHRRQACGCDQV